jgi:hypothetical protein
MLNECENMPGILFRVRGSTNQFGEIAHANYGKIHPAFKFGGASKDGASGFSV